MVERDYFQMPLEQTTISITIIKPQETQLTPLQAQN